MKTAAIYCRVSTEDQEREGTSLDSQREACVSKAMELGYTLPDAYVFKEIWSGLTLERCHLEELRQLVKERLIDGLIVYSTDRLSRDPLHLLLLADECEKSEVNLCFVTEPTDNSMEGQLLSFVRGWASKLEAIKIQERSLRGKRMRAKEGKLLGTRTPYGYKYLPGKGVGEGVRYIDENQAMWVKEMFRWLVEEGLSIYGITCRLRTLGVPTPSGRSLWDRSSVHRMLKNRVYTGKTYVFTQTRIETQNHRKSSRKNRATRVVFKPVEEWIEIPNATPPILSEELYNAAQERLKKNKELASRNAKREYLLRCHVFCGRCGRRYTGVTATIKTKKGITEQSRYRCPKNMKIISPIPCRNRSWTTGLLDRLVWGEIEQLLIQPESILAGLETKQAEAEKEKSYQVELETVQCQLNHARKEKDRIWKAFEFTGDEAKFEGEIKEIMARFEALEIRKAELENRVEMSRQADNNAKGIEKFCELARRNITDFSFSDKRLALEALDIKVRVDGEDVIIEGAIPLINDTFASATPPPALSIGRPRAAGNSPPCRQARAGQAVIT
jgi:site-specific DNA recombinase